MTFHCLQVLLYSMSKYENYVKDQRCSFISYTLTLLKTALPKISLKMVKTYPKTVVESVFVFLILLHFHVWNVAGFWALMKWELFQFLKMRRSPVKLTCTLGTDLYTCDGMDGQVSFTKTIPPNLPYDLLECLLIRKVNWNRVKLPHTLEYLIVVS